MYTRSPITMVHIKLYSLLYSYYPTHVSHLIGAELDNYNYPKVGIVCSVQYDFIMFCLRFRGNKYLGGPRFEPATFTSSV